MVYFGIRRIIQQTILLLTIAAGIQFVVYVFAATGNALPNIARPPSVEGFLPIGALISWKRFFATGAWDPVHPAAMVIFGFAILLSFLLRNAFCGWFCPVGTVSEWCYRTGESLFGKIFLPPRWLDIPLRGMKYGLLGFFVWIIYTMDASAIGAFQNSPYYRMADVKMLYLFLRPTTLTLIIIGTIVVLSFVIRHFWCRYLCPYGALTGLVAVVGPTRVRRNQDACIGCGRCRSACPKRLPIDRKSRIITPECIGCMECVTACPAEGALSFTSVGKDTAWPVKRVGITIAATWLILIYAATLTGNWKSGVSDREFQMRLKQMDSAAYQHPKKMDESMDADRNQN
ncbi:MAG: 4Fe-4S binding protein [Desulfobacterales bacterium]|nr:4Fe-4S binding protein [Desulfobacterales bacterium]